MYEYDLVKNVRKGSDFLEFSYIRFVGKAVGKKKLKRIYEFL